MNCCSHSNHPDRGGEGGQAKFIHPMPNGCECLKRKFFPNRDDGAAIADGFDGKGGVARTGSSTAAIGNGAEMEQKWSSRTGKMPKRRTPFQEQVTGIDGLSLSCYSSWRRG